MANGTPPETLWEMIKGWAVKPTQQYIYQTFPLAADEELTPNASYFRLWLKDMNLLHDRAWFTDQYPAVQSSVKLTFDGRPGQIFSRVAQPSKEVMGPGVRRNYVLLEQMPYSGDVVELEAGLFALKGKNYLTTTIGILDDFSQLIGAPLTSAMEVVKKVSSGIEHALQTSNGSIHLGLHQAFSEKGSQAENVLRSGYFAVLLATTDKLNRQALSVKDGQLYYTPPDKEAAPLRDVEFMLFHLEALKQRANWRMSNILEPINKAKDALLTGDKRTAKMWTNQALGIAWKSPDLVSGDRRRVVDAIKKELAEVEESVGAGVTGLERRDLGAIVAAHGMKLEDAAALGEMTYEEVFG
jgi:hypothetical protein